MMNFCRVVLDRKSVSVVPMGTADAAIGEKVVSDAGASKPNDIAEALPLAVALRRYFKRCAPPQDVDDLVQEVFLNLQSRQRETKIENLEGYVFMIARNLARRRMTTRHLVLTESSDDLDVPCEITPEQIAIGQDSLRRVECAIRALPPRTRQVFVLHRFEEMTYPSIARGLGISVSAVEKHIMAGLKVLRDAMGGEL